MSGGLQAGKVMMVAMGAEPEFGTRIGLEEPEFGETRIPGPKVGILSQQM